MPGEPGGELPPPTLPTNGAIDLATQPDPPVPEKLSTVARVKAGREAINERLEKSKAELERRRGSSWMVDAAMSSVENDTSAGGAVLAGAVAFRVFLFQVPYIFVVVTLLGAVKTTSDSASGEVDKVVGIGTLTAEAIGTASNLTTWGRIWALAVGGTALFLGARTALKVLRVVHSLLWGIPIRKANLTRAACGFIAVVTVGMIGSLAAAHVRADSFIGGVAATILATCVFGALFVLVELRMPRPDMSTWRDMVPGALLVTVGLLGLHLVTVYWIAYLLDSKSETYGALGSALALLFWAYLLGRILIASVVLNAVMWARHHPVERGELTAPL